MKDLNLQLIKKIHFIGIGGIGVSATARMMLEQNKQVSGSDLNQSAIIEQLVQAGAEVYFGHQTGNLAADVDLVVYTIAVTEDNPELAAARDRGVSMVSYPEFLGLISQDKYTVAVAGTHGKTTTTAMLSGLCEASGVPATTIVGSLLNGRRSNFFSTGDQYLLVEACEYRRSFLHLTPTVLIITNIEADHLDYYHDLADIQSAFRELARRVPADGAVITDPTNESLQPVLQGVSAKIIDYTQEPEPKPPQPGRHNILNAQAALAAAKFLGVEEQAGLKVLAGFAGTWRRFEYKGQTATGALVYDDYAHHPGAIRTTLAGFRDKFPDHKLVVAFQPHLYSRTKALFHDFADTLARADQLVILPIYAAREQPDPEIDHHRLAEAIRFLNDQTLSMSDLDTAYELLHGLGPDTVIATIGAGDIFQLADRLVRSEESEAL